MSSMAYDYYVKQGIIHVERAEAHARSGHIDYAFGSLKKAQRDFDKAIDIVMDRLKNPLSTIILDSIAEHVSADLDHVLMTGNLDARVPSIIAGRCGITRIGFASRVLRKRPGID